MMYTITMNVCAFFSLLFLAGCSADAADKQPATRPAVVVELFSSEGCSSCPPADELLAQLAKPGAVDGVEIIPLEMHVDYWNHLGWKDPFSSAAFSSRQRDYSLALPSQVYTPQMIVNGSEEFVGSDQSRAVSAIIRAAAKASNQITLSIMPSPKDASSIPCEITVDSISNAKVSHVMLAVTEDGLSTEVPRGENAGQALHHAAVVRSLTDLGLIKPGDAMPFSLHGKIPVDKQWKLDHLHASVFLQAEGSMQITGSTSVVLMQQAK